MKQIKKSLSIFMATLSVAAAVLGNVTAKAAVGPTISRVGLGHALVAGDTRTFTVTSANYVGNVQYRAFIKYTNHTKWTEITKGYTIAANAKTTVVLPATHPIALGTYTLSILVRKAGSTKSYDSYKVSALSCTNTIGATISKSNIVAEHSPLVVGDTEKIKVTSNFAGRVQYKAYLSDNTGKIFTALSTDYGVVVDAKTPFLLPTTPVFKLGTYRLSVWVKRAGETGVKTTPLGSYDNYAVLNLNTIPKVDVDPILAAAKTAVIALQTAAAKDLTVSANLTGAEALIQPAKDAVAKVSDADKIALTSLITLESNKITTARTTFDATAAYATLKAGVETKVAAYEVLANGTLTTQRQVTAAITAKTAIVTTGLTAGDIASFKTRTDAANVKVRAAAQGVIDYAALKAGVETKVAAYTTLANGSLTTQVLVDAANTAKTAVVLTGLNAVDTATFQATIDAANVKVAAAQKVIDDATTAVFNTIVKPSSSGFGVTGNVTLTPEGLINFATATKYVIFDGVDPITSPNGTLLGKETTIYPAKTAGSLVTVKLLNASAVLVKSIDVKLGESGTIPVVVVVPPVEAVVNATVKPSTTGFGSIGNVTSTQAGAVSYQLFDGTNAISAISALGTATTVFPGKVVGQKVTVELFNAAGTVIATKTLVALVVAQ